MSSPGRPTAAGAATSCGFPVGPPVGAADRRHVRQGAPLSPRAIRRTAVGLILAGALLRFHGLDERSVWHDEALAIHRAAQPGVGEALTAGPLLEPHAYTLALHGWLRFGAGVTSSGPTAILPGRALSACASTVALVFAWRLLAGWLPAGAALGALALLAVSPFEILYAHQVRPYALRLACELAAGLALVRAARTGSRRDLAVMALAGCVASFTHVIALAWLPAAAVWLVLRGGTPPGGWRRWTVTLVSAGVPALLDAVVRRAAIVHATAASPRFVGPGDWWMGAVQHFGAGPWVSAPLAAPAIWMFAFAGAAGLLRASIAIRATEPSVARRQADGALPRETGAALLAFGLVPPVLLLASHWAGFVYQPKIRYAVGAHPFLLAAVACGLGWLPRLRWRKTAYATLFLLELVALRGFFGGGFPSLDLPPCLKPHRDVAALISREARPGDVVAAFEFSAYTPLRLLLRDGPPVTYLLRDPLSTDAELDDLGHPTTIAGLARTARRIWLVVAPVHYRDPLDVPGETLAALRAVGTLERETTVPGIRIQRWLVRGR